MKGPPPWALQCIEFLVSYTAVATPTLLHTPRAAAAAAAAVAAAFAAAIAAASVCLL